MKVRLLPGTVIADQVRQQLFRQPPPFSDMMSRRIVDGITGARPIHIGQEFRDNISFRRALDMFPVDPPPEIISLLHGSVRAFKEGNLFSHMGRYIVDSYIYN